MNASLVIFFCAVAFVAFALWLVRAIISAVVGAAAQHARTHSRAYAICGGLMASALLSTFDVTFRNLTKEQAADTPWWVWVCYFAGPIASGVAVFVAFLQRPPSKEGPSQ